jgi:hypothetical protein
MRKALEYLEIFAEEVLSKSAPGIPTATTRSSAWRR